MIDSGRNTGQRLNQKLLLINTLAAAQCEVFPGELLEVLVLAGGVEHGHLGLDGEQETLS